MNEQEYQRRTLQSQERTIERLGEVQKGLDQLEVTVSDLQAENARLKAALEPFAAMYNVFPERWRNGELPVGSIYGFEDAEITFADLKRAADALEGGE